MTKESFIHITQNMKYSSCSKIFFASVILLFITTAKGIIAQPNQSHTIEGVIVDKETGEAIAGANAYISQTTIGTFTDSTGVFEFSTNLRGVRNLVFSYVGYHTVVQEINLYSGERLNFTVELEPESLELNPLEVTASNSEWQKNFEIFKRNFIGATGAALNTEIENPWVLSFERDSAGNLVAQAENPLSIKNFTIGYEMQVDLFEFEWPLNGGSGYYLFYANYKEMEPLSEQEQESWNRNRRQMYLGSFEHFLGCLYQNRLAECEFDVVIANSRNSVEIPQIDRQTARRLGVYSSITGLPQEDLKVFRLRFPVDVLYGERRWYSPNRVRSRIVPRSSGGIFLVTNRGRLANPLAFRLDGVWSHYRLANLLPDNYQPDE